MKAKFILFTSALALSAAAYAQTTKKVLLEDFTGAWCQFCPNGTHAMEELEAQYPNTFIGVASHNTGGRPIDKDVMEIPFGDSIAKNLGVTGYPTSAIDRKKFGSKIPVGIDAEGTNWKTYVPQRLAVSAIASVSFSQLRKNTDGSYEGAINVKFNAAPTANVPIVVNVYVLESKIPAEGTVKQVNCTKWYGGPDDPSAPIYTTTASSGNKYYHDNVLRMSLGTDFWGWSDVIPATVEVGKIYTKHFKFTLPADAKPELVKPENMDIVGFVAYNGSLSADQKEILNAEKMSSALFFTTGVQQVNNVNINGIYPNPATTSETVNVEFNVVNSGKVTIKVLNAIGQVVATPYISDDVRGIHTARFSPAYYSLAPGMYMVQVSTVDGSTVQKLNIQ